ncbi:SDR family NAD(P)-dependent oxidoreductase [Leptospira sp. 96542]|nr:SDR family NAD(P)-dependent oxidoreductase [Leptospira sp. 96542]
MKLSSKKIVFASVSPQFGKTLLETILKEGALVVVGSLSPESIPDHPNLYKYKIDPSKPDQIDRLIETSIEILDKIDVYITNFGVVNYGEDGDGNWTALKSIFVNNAISPIYTVQKLHQLLPVGVHILLVSTLLNQLTGVGYAVFTATKMALDGFAKTFRRQMGNGFHLTVLYPTLIESDSESSAAFPQVWWQEKRQNFANKIVRVVRRPEREVYSSFAFRIFVNLLKILPFSDFFWQNWQLKRLKQWKSNQISQSPSSN